jgi:hypothetical protein
MPIQDAPYIRLLTIGELTMCQTLCVHNVLLKHVNCEKNILGNMHGFDSHGIIIV